jgi:hypothetical protein
MSYAWIANAEEAFEAVQFVREVSGGKIEVRNGQGQALFIDPEQILGAIDDQSELHQMPDDLVMLDKIDEPSILQVHALISFLFSEKKKHRNCFSNFC